MSKTNVLIIGHSAMTRAMTATGFQENGSTINHIELKNAEVRYVPLFFNNVFFEKEEVLTCCS